MRTTLVTAFIAMTFFCAFAFAGGNEKIDVEVANVSLSDVNVAITATTDHHFALGDKVLDPAELKAFLSAQQKARLVHYVLVSGEKMTIADLVVVARIGEALGFTVLFESKGQLKSLKLVK